MPDGLSRRNVLGVAVSSPVAVLLPQKGQAQLAWEEAARRYASACQTHEHFLAQVLDPVARSLQREGVTPPLPTRLVELEEQGDHFCLARHDALARLVHTPAPDLQALRFKLASAYHDVLRHSDHEGLLQAILEDLQRLAARTSPT